MEPVSPTRLCKSGVILAGIFTGLMLPGVILPENGGMDFTSLEKNQLCAVNVANNMYVCMYIYIYIYTYIYMYVCVCVPYNENGWQS